MAIVVAVAATAVAVVVVVAVNKLRASLPAVFAVNSVLQNSSHTPNTIKLMKSQRTQWHLAKGGEEGADWQGRVPQ